MAARYAIYFVPPPDTDLAKFGVSWLGWDIDRAETKTLDAFRNLNHEAHTSFVQNPKKYGFHATLKAPFRLRPGTSVEGLLAAVDKIASRRPVVRGLKLALGDLGSFLALITVSEMRELNSLSEAFVVGLDAFRAPMNSEERARRRPESLKVNQRRYLERFGYPYVKEEYRFHMTLTGQLKQVDRDTAYTHLQTVVDPILQTPLDIAEVAVVVQDVPTEPFRVLKRFSLGGSGHAGISEDARSAALFLVVGPSGAGKDSLIDGARAVLAGNENFIFPKRTITRPADAGGEAHRSVSENTFAREAAAGKFALSWQAHGLSYGVPSSIASNLAQGRSVIVNVSRGVLNTARQQFGSVRVLSVRASKQTLAARLANRGRESSVDIENRLRRAASYSVSGSDVIEIFNDGALEEAVERFTAALQMPD